MPTLDRLDYKSALQELTAHRNLSSPEYSLRSTGPDHDKTFFATVKVAKAGRRRGRGPFEEVGRAGCRRGRVRHAATADPTPDA